MLGKNTILIFDYSRYDRAKAREIISSCGSFNIVEIDTISAAQKFLSMLELDISDISDISDPSYESPVRFILIDIKFPSVDMGFDLLKALKGHPVTNVPVIIATRESELANRDRASVEGVTDFIEKPASALRFEKSVKSVLASSGREESSLFTFEGMGDYSIPIKSFISREINLAKKLNYPLSVLYFLVNEDRLAAVKENFLRDLKESFYNSLKDVLASKLSETDSIFANETGDIFIMFPGTPYEDALRVMQSVNDSVASLFNSIELDYKDYFYGVCIAAPDNFDDIDSFIKSVSQKVEATLRNAAFKVIPSNIRKYANKRYYQFALWFHRSVK